MRSVKSLSRWITLGLVLASVGGSPRRLGRQDRAG